MKKIMIISAHPDDEVLGCGGLLSKFKDKGPEIKVLFIGEGSTCRYEDFKSQDAQKDIQIRNDYALSALNLLGVSNIEFNNLPCGRLDMEPVIKINKIIEKAIRDFKPDTIFTHSPKDTNNDHKIVFKSTLMSTRPCNQHIVKKIYTYEVLSSSEWHYLDVFKPNVFLELSEKDIENKCKAMEIYETEIRPYPFPRSSQAIKALSMRRGTQSGTHYAEAYCLIREFIS